MVLRRERMEAPEGIALGDPVTYLRGLHQVVSAERIDAILSETGRTEQRRRRIPARATFWLTIAMSLLSRLSIPMVWRRLHASPDRPEPTTSAICQARRRLGVLPLKRLYQRLAVPMAGASTPGAFYRGMRMMAIDGTFLTMPDTPANGRTFGYKTGGRGPAAYPQAHLLALCEVGTHATCALSIRPSHWDEQRMVPALVDAVQPHMLVLVDRHFYSFPFIRQVLARRAHVLVRVKAKAVLPTRERLPDGSFLSKLYPSPADRDQDRHGIPVRVLRYTHDDPARPHAGEPHALLTDLLEPEQLPAHDMPWAYHQRWEEELAFDEIKTHLNGRRVHLRSKTPAGVLQEIYGLMLAHYIIRTVMCDAAQTEAIPPIRLSFTDTLCVIEARLPEIPWTSPSAWYDSLLTEVARQRLPPRRDRWYPRVVKRKMSKFAKKRPQHYHLPQPTKPFMDSLIMLN
jgi:IS4 transposase